MDEAFWSNVVKRWSEASENVLKLKKELARVEEERTIFREALHNLRKPELRNPSLSRTYVGPGHARDESSRTIVADDDHLTSELRDELQDAEVGLGRAKEEYHRLQKALAESAEKVKALTLENERLTSSHQQEMNELRNERKQIVGIQKELLDSQSRNHDLVDKVRSLEEELSYLRSGPEQTPELTPKPSFFDPSSIRPLERQVELLKQTADVCEGENHDLREELASLQEKLDRAEENNKVLTRSIMRLQDIARHSMTGALQAISSNLPSRSARSSKRASVASSNRSNALDLENANTSVPSMTEGPSHVGDITVVDSHPSSMKSSPYPLLPSERELSLSKLPVVQIKDISSDNSFDRDFLKNALGDGLSSLVQRLGLTEEQATIAPYLCPTLNHHHWCPSAPGQHGYIFVGIGKEQESYRSPAIRNLFVGLAKTQPRGRKFRYLGTYRVSRARSLSVEEWNILPEDVKVMYAKLTKEKAKDSRTAEDIVADYDHGDLLVPCVLLQCISFDDRLYEALVSQRDTEPKF